MLWCLDVIVINVSRVHWCRQVGHGRIRVQIKRGEVVDVKLSRAQANVLRVNRVGKGADLHR
jgi:hypothetical protein